MKADIKGSIESVKDEDAHITYLIKVKSIWVVERLLVTENVKKNNTHQIPRAAQLFSMQFFMDLWPSLKICRSFKNYTNILFYLKINRQ